jgi:hypothetical protein
MDVEAEIRDPKRRVGELEGSFGFLTEQISGAHRDLLAFQANTERSFSEIHGRLARLDDVPGRLDRIEKEARDLRRDLPEIVGSTLREVLREGRSQ